MDQAVPFASADYFIALALLCFGRGMDFFSTWLATPDLRLEANPIARFLGWRWGVVANLILCFVAARWPAPSIVIFTTSLLVAARNFRSVWLIRSVGPDRYRVWLAESLSRSSFKVYIVSVVGESALTGIIGLAVFYFGGSDDTLAAIGIGIIAYALAIGIYTTIALWRFHRSSVSTTTPIPGNEE